MFDVVRAGVFLTNMTDFAAMNGIYAKYFIQPFPARTTIAAADAQPSARSIDSFRIVHAHGGFWIASLLFDHERPGVLLSKKYLKNARV